MKRLNRILFSDKHYLFYLLFLIYLLPMLFLREDAYVTIHDNLDSEISWYTVLARSGVLFDPNAQVEQIMNGIPRVCLPSTWNVVTWLFVIFEPFTAYLVNYIFVHFIAFIGMYLLLFRHMGAIGISRSLAMAVSLCFAILPFYSIYGLSIAGQPLLLFVFLNLFKKHGRVFDYLVILLFSIYSSLFFFGVFAIVLLIGWIILDWIQNNELNRQAMLGVVLLGSMYTLVEYDLINAMLSHQFVSHRTEFDFHALSIPFYQSIKRAAVNFVFGQYHAASLHQFIIVVAVPLSIIFGYVNKQHSVLNILFRILVLNLLFSIIYGFQHWDGLIPLKEKIQLAYTFNWARFHWLHPTLWYIVFALTLVVITRIGRNTGKYIAIGLIAFQASFNLIHNPEWEQVIPYINDLSNAPPMSYRQFFAEDLFGQIREYIGKPVEDYRVVSIGLHPSIAQYNGFYTLDSYQHNYPLTYKHQFRRIIAPELAKNNRWEQYFDGWGSRCYVFVDGVDNFMVTKEQSSTIEHLSLDTTELLKMGGQYIFSAVKIENEDNIRLLQVFEDSRYPWRIYLYQVIDE